MYNPLKGFRDYYPKDWKELQENIFSKARKIAEIFGFEEINMPLIEETEFLTKKSGDEIKQQIFNILPIEAILLSKEKKCIESEIIQPKMSLRFDLTIPSIRMVLKKYKQLVKPIKWFYIEKNYRYEEPQKGREREFFQIGVEFYGEKEFIADLEVLNFAISVLNEIGLKDKYKIKVNDRVFMEYFVNKYLKEPNPTNIKKLFNIIDKMRKISEEEFKNKIKELIKEEEIENFYEKIKKPQNLEDIKKFFEKEITNEKLKENLIKTINYLKLLENKAKIEWDFSIIRGLDYYDGFIFEIYDIEEKYRSLGGGGRYNKLANILGFKEEFYATGVALGPSVLEVLMKEKNIWKEIEIKKDFLVIPVNPKNFEEVKYCYKITNFLREKGKITEFGYKKNLSKNLDYGNKIKVKYSIIIGEEELKNKKLLLKNMESGEEKKITLEELNKILSQI